MQEPTSSLQDLSLSLQEMMTQITAYLPRVMMAALVLLLGWLLARLFRLLVVRAVGKLDHLWQSFISRQGMGHLPPRQPPVKIVGELIFWLVLLIFVTLSAEILGLSIFGLWLKEIISYLPLIASGLLIILIGFVVSSLSRDLVVSAANTSGSTHGDILGRATQFAILFVAIIIGVDQIGIDIAFISIVAGIVLASLLGGIALAFGLGARTHVSNIIAANQLRQIYQLGDKVRIGDIEGRIIDIMVSRVIIETETGSFDIPAKIFDEQVTVIIEKGS